MMKRTSLILFLLVILYPFFVYADFEDGGKAYIKGDYETAAKEFIPLADRGDHRAMYALGSMYAAGHGVEKDLTKSFKLFSEAAKNGRADAMYKLGLMYENGQGIKPNIKKAIRYYQKSAKKGYPLAQYRFGLMYEKGLGAKQNPVKAYAWFVVAGHYFIYEVAEDDNTDKMATSTSDNRSQLQLVQQKEKDEILDDIIKHLLALKNAMSTDEIEEARKHVIEFSKYANKYNTDNIKNISKKSNIENLFFLETLY